MASGLICSLSTGSCLTAVRRELLLPLPPFSLLPPLVPLQKPPMPRFPPPRLPPALAIPRVASARALLAAARVSSAALAVDRYTRTKHAGRSLPRETVCSARTMLEDSPPPSPSGPASNTSPRKLLSLLLLPWAGCVASCGGSFWSAASAPASDAHRILAYSTIVPQHCRRNGPKSASPPAFPGKTPCSPFLPGAPVLEDRSVLPLVTSTRKQRRTPWSCNSGCSHTSESDGSRRVARR